MKRKCYKVKFKDELEAMIALANTQRSRKGKRAERRYYWCSICNAWHLTSQHKRDIVLK